MAARSLRLQSAVVLFAFVLLIFLLTAVILAFLPQDLSDLEGRNQDAKATGKSRNITRVLSNAAEKGIEVTLTEEELNQWLANQINGIQEGPLKDIVSYRGIWIRLKDGSLDLIFEREAFNRPHTIAMNVEIEQLLEEQNQVTSSIHWRGGRLGQMPVTQGYLRLVLNGYRELADVMSPEVDSLKSLLEGRTVVTLKESSITFTPREIGNSIESVSSF